MTTPTSDIDFDTMTDRSEGLTEDVIVDAMTESDPFHGREHIAAMLTRFIVHLFNCPVDHPMPKPSERDDQSTPKRSRLDHSIAYALHRTRLDVTIAFAAIFLLHRFKQLHPSSTGSSGHRLFIVAYMLAAKMNCDGTYNNVSWCIVGQDAFTLCELNEMERDMCFLLEWDLLIDEHTLSSFVLYVIDNYLSPESIDNVAPFQYRIRPGANVQPHSRPSGSPDGVHPSLGTPETTGVEQGPAMSPQATTLSHMESVVVVEHPKTETGPGYTHSSIPTMGPWRSTMAPRESDYRRGAPDIVYLYPFAIYWYHVPGYWYPVATHVTSPACYYPEAFAVYGVFNFAPVYFVPYVRIPSKMD